MEENQISVLESLESELVQASSGKRLANYILDVIVFYLFVLFLGIVIGVSSPGTLSSPLFTDAIISRIFGLALYGVFMGVYEAITKGKTVGKLITGTKAVNQDGTTISFKTGLLRGFSRAVPLEVFSGLGSPCFPWHDKWTDTYVIDLKESHLI
jgi:uncharacterized RDD family membrane protein YckC